MSSQAKLLRKIETVLKSRECFAIRFRIENVAIQTHMYQYIVQAIHDNRIRAQVGSGDGYDDTVNPHTLTLSSDDPPPRTVVHEATHAVIDATHKGQRIVKSTNEIAAFLAESVYGVIASDPMTSYPHYFVRPLRQLADQVVAFNSSHPSGLFDCPPGDVANLKALLSSLPGSYGTANKIETMKGIGDGA